MRISICYVRNGWSTALPERVRRRINCYYVFSKFAFPTYGNKVKRSLSSIQRTSSVEFKKPKKRTAWHRRSYYSRIDNEHELRQPHGDVRWIANCERVVFAKHSINILSPSYTERLVKYYAIVPYRMDAYFGF